MQYFSTIPKIIYNNPITNNPVILTNILTRSTIIPTLLQDPLLFYQYDVQEGDTPDIVAQKYYGDSYRYWLVLFSNFYLDPQWSWPLNYNQFNAYIQDKYNFPYDPTNPNTSVDPYTTIQSYQMTVTKYNSVYLTTSSETFQISANTYNLMPQTSYATYTLPAPDGQVEVTTTTQAVSYYDYETNLNESKRSIYLLNSKYADEVESEFKKLMAQ